jgi:hypothetical protein
MNLAVTTITRPPETPCAWNNNAHLTADNGATTCQQVFNNYVNF